MATITIDFRLVLILLLVLPPFPCCQAAAVKNLRGAAGLYAATMGISLFFWKVKPWWSARNSRY